MGESGPEAELRKAFCAFEDVYDMDIEGECCEMPDILDELAAAVETGGRRGTEYGACCCC